MCRTAQILAAASVFIVATLIAASGAVGKTSNQTSAWGTKAVAKENRRALIIGVDYFPCLPTKKANEEVPKDASERPADKYALHSCVKDAKNLAEAFVKYAGFQTENVYLMTFQRGDAFDPNDRTVPTAANIRRKVDELVEKLSKDDLLVVVFCGHGVTLGVDSNDDSKKRSYLCACDADQSALSTFVDRKELLDKLETCRAERKIFLSDCCRDAFELLEGARYRGRGLVDRSTGAANLFETGNYGFAQISACREGQRALETSDGGLFTTALIEGLRFGANEAGEISLTEWFDYAYKITVERSEAILKARPELGADNQKAQEPMCRLLTETTRWIFADGLPVDGVALTTWNEADALWTEAGDIRGRLKAGLASATGDGENSARVAAWKKAKAKIEKALELTAEASESSVRRGRYVEEKNRLTEWAQTEANKLADAALKLFERGERQKAIATMKESLALVDSASNRRWLETFVEKENSDDKNKRRLVAIALAATALGLVVWATWLKSPVGSDDPDNSDDSDDSDERNKPGGGAATTKNAEETARLQENLFEGLSLARLVEDEGFAFGMCYCMADDYIIEEARRFYEKAAQASTTFNFEEEPAPGTRRALIINGVELAFRYCPPGMFRRTNETEQGDAETVQNGFWLMETAVTRDMYKAIVGFNPSAFKLSANHPLTDARWKDCQDFLKSLNALNVVSDDCVFRLPTEAEWEYACRAGISSSFSWDDMSNDARSNGENSPKPYWWDRKVKVDGGVANPWGLYDMRGNVWEWCEDWPEKDVASAETKPTVPEARRGFRIVVACRR